MHNKFHPNWLRSILFSSNAQPNQPAHRPESPRTNTADLVWQWACYSLWEAALISLVVLFSATSAYFFANDSNNNFSFVVYILATTLCLLPLAYFTDRQYGKVEPTRKHGFAAVILVLNALAVFLVAVAALITFVVSLFSRLVTTAPSDTVTVVSLTALLVAAVGGLLFGRILNTQMFQRFDLVFPMIIAAISIVILLFAIAGPVRSSISNRQDRLIENNLSDLGDSVQDFTDKHHRLPVSLTELSDEVDQNGVKVLIDKQLVSYQPGAKIPPDPSYGSAGIFTYKYKLCAEYNGAKGSASEQTAARTDNGHYLDTYAHGAGRQCYSQETY